ncbi:MAG: fibronectin type III domain-containing protein [Acidobacteria bacterium]|nr:fibronectin type III domain-containing protein [Acidobacteriota bacterium]
MNRLVMAAVALCALPLPATAQRVVISYSPVAFTPPVIQSWNLDTGRLEWQRDGESLHRPVITADGQFVVAGSGGLTPTFQLVDARTGATTLVPVSFTPLVAHPRATAVFGLVPANTGAGVDVARIDAAGLAVYGGCAAGTARDLDVSTDGRRLLVVCNSGELVVLNALSGVEVGRVAAGGAGAVREVASNLDGTRAVVVRGADKTSGDIARIDTASGAVLATTVFPGATPTPTSGDCVSGALTAASPDRTLVTIECSWVNPLPSATRLSYATRVLNADTLTWQTDLGVNGTSIGLALAPANDRAVVMSGNLPLGAIQILALPSGAPALTVAGIVPFGLAAAFAPLAPVLSSSVSGSRVDLQWTLPVHSPAATGYLLEIGTAPGLSDLGRVPLGPDLALSVPGAPPGAYAVRLRAVNAVGPGAVSNELTVVVP